MSIEKRGRSLARRPGGVIVAASPFNGLKLELALLVAGAALVAGLVPRWVPAPLAQLGCMAGYGALAGLWVVFRARRILRRSLLQDPGVQTHGAQQE